MRWSIPPTGGSSNCRDLGRSSGSSAEPDGLDSGSYAHWARASGVPSGTARASSPNGSVFGARQKIDSEGTEPGGSSRTIRRSAPASRASGCSVHFASPRWNVPA